MPRNCKDIIISSCTVLGLLLLAARAPPTIAQGVTCPAPEGVITDDTQLQEFLEKSTGCTVYSGNVMIGYQNCSIPCDITSFSFFDGISILNGSLSIQCCHRITDMNDFPLLMNVLGSVIVYYNRELRTISGFPELLNIQGSITISQNPKLTTIRGLNRLGTIGGYLAIEFNPLMTDFEGLNQLSTISGRELQSGHALNILYNTNLASLGSLSSLAMILYGTVHIEGNTALCYAGYPIWNFGSYPLRLGSSISGVDKGIDWRTKLSRVNSWQYTWEIEGGGYPTLLIQNNAPTGSCSTASCHSSCLPNAGCLGPNNPALCGLCDLIGTFDPCQTESTVPPRPTSSTPVILGVVLTIVFIVALVLLGLGIWGCVVLGRKWKEGRHGSFDISIGGIEATDYDGGRSTKAYTSSKSIGKSSDLIASYSASSESAIVGGYVKTNKMSNGYGQEQVLPSSNLSENVHPSYSGAQSGVKSRPVGSAQAKKRASFKQRKKQNTSSENLLSSSRDNISRDSPNSQSSLSNDAQDFTSAMQISDNFQETKMQSSSLEQKPGVEYNLQQGTGEVPMNFPKEQVKLGKEMGIGDFGKVLQADARKLLPGQKKTTVVVKQLKQGASEVEKEAFLRPVEAMKMLQHPNVLSLMGVVSQGPTLLVMLENCSLGNFKTYLVTKRRDAALMKNNGQLLRMATDMASGLGYLHSKSIAHNDFAARSCMVTGEGRVKLGDYGITRQTFKEDYYSRGSQQKAWPIRWMAPEQVIVEGRNVLDSLPVSMPANIWSLGVALWEVCSFAQWPYDEMSNEEVIQSVITSGKCCLENPLEPNDPIAHLFDICQLCWQETALRPTMEDLLPMLSDPTLIKKKKRRSSLARQVPLSTTPPRSQVVSDSSQPTSPGGVISPGKEDTLKRSQTTGTGQKPRRPAPSKPAPSRPAPTKPAPIKPISKESGITKPDKKKSSSPQSELHNSKGSSGKSLANPGHNPEILDHQEKKEYRDRGYYEGMNRAQPSSMMKMVFDVPEDDAEFPPLEDMDDEDFDESLFVGGAESLPVGDDKDDFILEPPEQFSQSSLDDLDDFNHEETKGEGESVMVEFQPPTISDDDIETNFNDNEFVGEVEQKLPQKKAGETTKKSKKKKKRTSKDYSSVQEGDDSKQKPKKKKKRKSVEKETDFPEYEFDRGMDKIPTKSSDRQAGSSYSNEGYLSGSIDRLNSQSEFTGSYSPHGGKPAGKHPSRGKNYEDVVASDDFSPPWLDEDYDERADDAREMEEDDIPNSIVYNEDVAALIW